MADTEKADAPNVKRHRVVAPMTTSEQHTLNDLLRAYEHSILWSQTIILNEKDRIPRLEDFLPNTDPEP